MCLTPRIPAICSVTLSVLFAVLAPGSACADTLGAASEWTEGFNNKARLLAGRGPDAGAAQLYAGVEIVMPAGWKTYWRAPGDAGGIPPEFDWAQSVNIKSFRVLYPAPHRMIDKTGSTIGYKEQVVFPAAIEPQDKTKPVTLKLKAAYGVCKELCVPAEVELSLEIPVDAGPSPVLADAVQRVPGVAVAGRDPVLTAWRVEAAGTKPKLVLDVTDPGGEGGDAFVDSGDGIYLPLPKRVSGTDGRIAYEVDLTDGVEYMSLIGKSITVTLVGASGQSESTISIGK
jgi:DsbC/DsbD-like thiol-disulfide interchange protein